MKEAELPLNEFERMELVRQLDILDTDSEEIYDGITYIASKICNTPISTITIVDHNRQWFKSIVGGKNRENPRSLSFCAHTILGSEILEIPDSRKDERFKDNPLVTGEPHVIFYAGAPLELNDGLNVGSLCVIDSKPNKLSDEQLKMLHFLSQQVTQLLDLRLKVKEVQILRENDKSVVNMLTHELKNPLIAINGFLSYTTQNKEKYQDKNYDSIIEKCLTCSDRMLNIVNQFLSYAHWKEGLWAINKGNHNINACIKQCSTILKGYLERCKVDLELKLDESIPNNNFDYTSILSVLENLISNAAKHSPEGEKVIVITEQKDNFIKVTVQDHGSGIAEKDRDKIFKPFALHNSVNRANIKGSGLGLSIAKKIVDKHGGTLDYNSIENKETNFYFTLPI